MKEHCTIVTGARGLIGKTVSRKLVESGLKVLEIDLQLGHDLTNEEFVRHWFANNTANSLINLFALNDHVEAGQSSNRLMDISLESFDHFLRVNLTTLFSVCREFARNNRTGSIVNFSSTYGLVSPIPELYGGNEKHIAYGVSKAGVIQLSRHLSVHLAPIRVNCVVPGGVLHKQGEEFQNLYGKYNPLGRMMHVEEIFGIVEFLISEKASYCTGSVYCVDGGWTAR